MRGLTRNQLILIVAAAVLVIGNILLLVFNIQAQGYRAALDLTIQEVEESIAWMTLHYDIDQLENQLAAAQQDRAEAPVPLSDDIDNPEVYDFIFEAAAGAKVHNDYDYEYKGIDQVVINGHEYQVFAWEITVTAKLSRIIEFIGLLEEGGQYDTLRITNIDFELQEGDIWEAVFDIEIVVQ